MTQSGTQLQQNARDTAAALDHVTHGRPFTPHLEVWKVREQVVPQRYRGRPDQQIVTVKVDPHHGHALRHAHKSIIAGQYLNKHHWISISRIPNVGGGAPTDALRHRTAGTVPLE